MSHPQMEAKQNHNLNLYEGKAYTLVGNIMLTAIIILFFVVILLLFLHLYPRWYLRRVRHRNRHHRRTPLVFYVDSFPSDVLSCGLDASVLRSLPVFLYSSNTPPHSEPVQCAVCLSEFKENEAGRVLPKCNHSFHVECIDMWFQSHSTCPLCRTLVEPLTASEVVINVCEPARPEQGSSSGLSADCQSNGQGENRIDQTLSSSSSSIELKRKPSSLVGGSIELPMTRSFGRGADVSGCGSPSTQSSFRSSMSRILSFKRILSREKKENFSPSSVGAVGCSSTTELDTERRGRDETQGS